MGYRFWASVQWLPLQEQFVLYGDGISAIGLSEYPLSTLSVEDASLPDPTAPVHGLFSEDFRCVTVLEIQDAPIHLAPKQVALFRVLWRLKGQLVPGHRVMEAAGSGSAKPGDLFKHQNYAYARRAFETLVAIDNKERLYALRCAKDAITAWERDVAEFSDKFVAFVDILGFKNLVNRASRQDGVSLDDLLRLTHKLGPTGTRNIFGDYGPTCCPEAPRVRKDLDFQVIQISDCVIVSSEVSPVGLINLIHYCWGSVLKLLTEGVLCRGYITRGAIYHTERQVIGPAYQEAYSREEKVSVFADWLNEKGTTPFVEIAPVVLEYVDSQSDRCVSEMFDRMVRSIPDGAALFPFKRLEATGAIGGAHTAALLKANTTIRENLHTYKRLMWSFGKPNGERALSKVRCYEAALDEQLRLCDELDRFVEKLQQPVVPVHHSRR